MMLRRKIRLVKSLRLQVIKLLLHLVLRKKSTVAMMQKMRMTMRKKLTIAISPGRSW
jgi:hypothetical protein